VNATKITESTRETFEALYDEYMPKVFRYIQYKVSNMQLTEDLTSIVFEKALTNFSKYSKDKAAFSTWIFSIARNTVIDHYRTRSRKQAVSLENVVIDIESKDPLPEEELDKKEEIRKLHLGLAKLSGEEQELISLKFSSEFNNRQIAKMLGLSESNVGTRLYRAVRKLRDSFRELENG